MSREEKIALLEETLEVDAGTLSGDMQLDDIPEYDSMTKLALIVLMEDEFGVKLSGEMIHSFQTVEDILTALG